MSVVAAAVIGSAVVGGIASNRASKKAGEASNYAVDASVNASNRQADLAERQYEESAPYRAMMLSQAQKADRYGDLAEDRTAQQFDFEFGNSKKYSDRYWGTQVPLEDEFIAEARNFDPEQFVDSAAAGMRQQGANTMAQMARYNNARGVNPTSGMAQLMVQRAMLDEAGKVAFASNDARIKGNQMKYARLGEATALGKGLPGFSSGSNQIAGALGNNGMSNISTGMNTIVNGSMGNNAAFATGSNLWGASSNTAGGGAGVYNTAMNTAYRDPMQSVYGRIAGGGMNYGFNQLGAGTGFMAYDPNGYGMNSPDVNGTRGGT